jgi:yecA family protein
MGFLPDMLAYSLFRQGTEQMAYSIDFDDLEHALMKINAAAEAAEAQGLICGILCALGRVDKQSWIQQVIGEAADPADLLMGEIKEQLDIVYQETLQSLYDEEYGFQLYLPDDEAPIEERIQTISEWCQGFLLGFSMRSIDSIQGESREEIEALLEDFVEVTRIDAEVSEDDDEDEESLVEIEEYIRMGVVYIFTSLNPVTGSDRLQ